MLVGVYKFISREYQQENKIQVKTSYKYCHQCVQDHIIMLQKRQTKNK